MSAPAPPTDPWFTERWAGEVRVNLFRLGALLAFFAVHIVRYYRLENPPPEETNFHLVATAVALAWGGMVVILYAVLRDHRLPRALPIVAVVGDAVLITTVAAAAGPRTPLLLLYWLVIASAPLRLSLPVVWAATLTSMAGYLVVLGHHVFVRVGSAAYYADPIHRIPRSHEAITILALAAAGVLAGQVVRQVQRLTDHSRPGEGPP